MNSKVSIITPCFNGAKTIEACVQSIRQQNYPDIEHIVVDGGSSDGTQAILDRLGVFYISGPDAGIYDAMNKGVALSSGNIIGILNCDDKYADNDVISTVVDKFDGAGCDVCHGRISLINEDGSIYANLGVNQNKTQLLKKMRVAHPSVFVKRSVYDRFGSFSVGFRIAGDYDFVLRIWDKTQVAFIEKVLVLMGREGVSSANAVRSLREAMAVSVIHGRHPWFALMDFYLNLYINSFRYYLRSK